MDVLLERNRAFAAAERHLGLNAAPRQRVIIVTCFDPRVDPAHILGVDLGDAVVLRNMGGRMTPDMCVQVAILTAMAERMTGDNPSAVEIALLHHTRCGAQSLADPAFRELVTERSATTDEALADIGVVDPTDSVMRDVASLRAMSSLPDWVSVNGYVYDVDTGVVARH